jgi:hypothetical protein
VPTLLNQESLTQELAELEQEQLNDRIMGADHVPVHLPAGSSTNSKPLRLFLCSELLTDPQQSGNRWRRKTTRKRSSRSYKQRWPCNIIDSLIPILSGICTTTSCSFHVPPSAAGTTPCSNACLGNIFNHDFLSYASRESKLDDLTVYIYRIARRY